MKITLDKSKCIGCGSCASLCPKFFELAEDGKSHLKGSKFDQNQQKEELEIEESGCVKEAAEACPVQAIQIEK
jgi:ferredoxin